MKNNNKFYDHQVALGIEYPSDPNAKKLYAVGCYSAEDWNYIHEILLRDGTLEDNIPHECCECADIKDHSATRAVYLLTDDEANELRNHPKVEYVHENFESYPFKYKPDPEEVKAGVLPKTNRYNSPQKNYGNWSDAYNIIPFDSLLPNPPTSEDFLRSGYQLLRCVEKDNPWWTGAPTGSNQIFTDRTLTQYGDATDVDVIVGDEGCWFGHVEFQTNATGGNPQNYRARNPLYAGFSNAAPSATTGTCDLLDLALDAPYWLDPAWFELDAANRLTLRWDGTTVPTEAAAKSWWSSASSRSASFLSLGTVTVNSLYTRVACNGSHTARPTIITLHGTQCTANAVGRTQGWAYNANKWSINAYGAKGMNFEPYFNIMKLFHLAKGVNPIYGNKNPTITSNSWGYRSSDHNTTGWYFYRSSDGISYTSATLPEFMYYVGSYGDREPTPPYKKRMKGEHLPNSALTAGKELIDAGVIFVGAAGNSNQKQVSSTHPDYNNYWSTVSSTTNLASSTHEEFGVSTLNTTNRRGYPQQLGSYTDGSGNRIYPVINIGALDDSFDGIEWMGLPLGVPLGLERKVVYSDMGNGIDCYAPGDGTLSASNHTLQDSLNYRPVVSRADTYPMPPPPNTDNAITGICLSGGELSGTSSFRALRDSAKRITTTASSGTVNNLTLSLLGAGTLTSSTTPTNGNGNDDGYWKLTLPFNIQFAGITTNIVFPGTNSYITFTDGSTAFTGLSYSNPSVPKIMISSSDNSVQRIYYGQGGVSPNLTYRIRSEGTTSFEGNLGSPNMVYEAVFYENNPSQIDIHVGINSHVSIGDPATLNSCDEKFSGTSSACPVACGLIATKLQYNRTWTWQNVKNWLNTSVGTANTSTPKFFTGYEAIGADSADWANVNSLQGGSPIVIWDALTGNEPFQGTLSIQNLSFKNITTK